MFPEESVQAPGLRSAQIEPLKERRGLYPDAVLLNDLVRELAESTRRPPDILRSIDAPAKLASTLLEAVV